MPYNLSQLTVDGYQLGYTGAYAGGPPSIYTIDITNALPCDSNSFMLNQGWEPSDEPVYMADPGLPYKVELINDVWTAVEPAVYLEWKAPYTGYADLDAADVLGNDINDFWQAPVGVSGTFQLTPTRQYADGSTETWTARMNAGSVLTIPLRDSKTKVPLPNLSGLRITVRTSDDAESTVYKTTQGTTDAFGVAKVALPVVGAEFAVSTVTADKASTSLIFIAPD